MMRVSEHGIDEFSYVILFDSFTFKHLNIKPIHKMYVNTGCLKKKEKNKSQKGIFGDAMRFILRDIQE